MRDERQNFIFIILFLFLFFLTSSSSAKANNGQQKAIQTEKSAQEHGLDWNSESINTSIKLYVEAGQYWEAENEVEKNIACLLEAGKLSMMLGNKDDAFSFFTQALKLTASLKLFNGRAKIFSQLSLLFLEQGKIKESKTYFEEALRLAKDDEAKAAAFFSAAEFYYYQREVGKSIKFYQDAIDIWHTYGNQKEEAKGMLYLAYACIYESRFNEAALVLKKALAKWQQTGNKRGEAFTYIALGMLYQLTGEKQRALDNYKNALSLFPADLDYVENARLQNGIGKIYEDYGEWDLSLNSRKQALELFQKEKHLYGQLATLPSIAKLSYLSGYPESALNYYKQTEILAQQLKDNLHLASVKQELGNFYYQNKAYAKALNYFEQSRSLLKKNHSKRLMAENLLGMGKIYKVTNNLPQARKCFLGSLELNIFLKDKVGEAETLFQLADVYQSEDKDEEALRFAEDSINLTENLSSDLFNSKLGSIYFSSSYVRYELYINLLMKMDIRFPENGYSEKALLASEKSRARSMVENLLLADINIVADADPESINREKEIRNALNLKTNKLTDFLSNNTNPGDAQKLNNEIKILEDELGEIKAHLKQNSPLYTAIKNPQSFNLSDFQSRILDDQTVFLEFFFGKENSYVWLISKNEVSHYVLPSRLLIESQIVQLRNLLLSRSIQQDISNENYQNVVVEADKSYAKESQIVSRNLFGQFYNKLIGKRMIIAADGELHYFPVSALPFPDTTEPFLLSNEIVYEPSASLLLLTAKSENRLKQATKKLLVFADPVFSNKDSRLLAESNIDENSNMVSSDLESYRFAESLNSLPRLIATKDEAVSIADIIGRSDSTIITGFAATRERFLSGDSSDYQFIHFATHGMINEDRPNLSAIVLSQFNEKGQQTPNFIRLQDIYELKLSAELIVLSACNTGIGKEVKGEALMSLNNAFLQSGAKSVVSSLWKVDDYATLELMKTFYAAMVNEKVTPSQALLQAQLKMRQNPLYNSPFYWAAFTIQGDFRHRPNLSTGPVYLTYFFIIMSPIFLFGLYRLFRFIRMKISYLTSNG